MQYYRVSMSWKLLLRLFISLFIFAVASDARHGYLKTEPDFRPETFIITRAAADRSSLAPGYYFLAPVTGRRTSGPQIYTDDGVLIWHGSAAHRAQNFHVCDYLGEKGTHLCYVQRRPGHKLPRRLYKNAPEVPKEAYNWLVVLDQSYNVAGANVTEGYNGLPFDEHAFETQDEGNTSTYLVQRPRVQDLRPYGREKEGWVANQCIGERDNRNLKNVFHWCYLEAGLNLWETQVFPEPKNHHFWSDWFKSSPNATAPDAIVMGRWDFLHINAVEKNDLGDYYVSVRHLSQIIKLAGNRNPDGVKPGTILWRMGGKNSDFTFAGWPLSHTSPFSRQHDIKFLYREGDEEFLSLFSNGWEGFLTPGQPYSDGQFLAVNSAKRTARLLRHYPHPDGKTAKGRGGTRELSNGNVLVGWGDVPEFTEFDKNGTVLQHVRIDQRGHSKLLFTYRAFKFPWIGKPQSDPKVVSRLRPCNIDGGQLTLKMSLATYVSWNGATEVSQWRFAVASELSGPWKDAGTFKKKEYETEVDLMQNYRTMNIKSLPYVKVEALDSDGKVIGSAVTKAIIYVEWLCEHWFLAGLAAIGLIFGVVESLVFLGRCCYRDQGSIRLRP